VILLGDGEAVVVGDHVWRDLQSKDSGKVSVIPD
jgi:hypothetical protein